MENGGDEGPEVDIAGELMIKLLPGITKPEFECILKHKYIKEHTELLETGVDGVPLDFLMDVLPVAEARKARFGGHKLI